METLDGFRFVAPSGYEGDICTICHMPPNGMCRDGVLPLDAETKDVATHLGAVASSHVACRQKVEWRNDWEEKQKFSRNETGLPTPREVVSRFAKSENKTKQNGDTGTPRLGVLAD